ncbi:MAG: hypothetical protein KKC75_01805 [Nanoarchaeota archaeon]|nr:hypothetical protein [Nanoarchaeota archaeon]MBU1005730.1 hypothetical protein [Nanoarchaeota archaeon]MBU1945585.1 hypothetical protein [Nanoarchaeota archaeon]
MKNNMLVYLVFFALFAGILFLGANITGFVVYKVEYNDLCKEDADCFGRECCRVYEDKPVGICMEHCQSFEFLCRADRECEEGTVCCIPEGKEYGICNYQDKCLNVDVFADYIGKVSFLPPSFKDEKMSPKLDMPARIEPKPLIIFESGVIVILLALIAFLLFRDNERKKDKSSLGRVKK